METAESLRRTIAVTEELQSVVKTMKALAGVNIRQYERAAHAVAEYNRTIEMGLQIALQRLPAHALPPQHALKGKLGAIVFGSDQGMCGQLNDQVVSHASRALAETGIPARRPERPSRWACARRRSSKESGEAWKARCKCPARPPGSPRRSRRCCEDRGMAFQPRHRVRGAVLRAPGFRRVVSRARRPAAAGGRRNGSTD